MYYWIRLCHGFEGEHRRWLFRGCGKGGVLAAPDVARELRRWLPGHPLNGGIAQVREITRVPDEAGGLPSGSVLNFLNVDHHVRFEISLTAAEREHLKISSELLPIAIRVQGGRRRPDDSGAF